MCVCSRRSFLCGLGAAIGYSAAYQLLQPRLLFGQAHGGSGRNLVLVNLIGGYDGMTHFPYYEGVCADIQRSVLRPVLHLPASSVLLPHTQSGLADKIGFNPAWARLIGNPIAQGISLPGEAAGNLRLLKTVGYTTADPGRSHDYCQNLYSFGKMAASVSERKGWLAKLMDMLDWDPLQLYGIGSGAKIDLNAEKQRPLIVGRLSDFSLRSRGFGGGTFRASESSSNVSTNAARDSAYARAIAEELLHNSVGSEGLINLLQAGDTTVSDALAFIAAANSLPLSGEYRAYNVNYLANPHNYTNASFLGLTTFQRSCQDCAKVLRQAAQDSSLAAKVKVVYLQRAGWDSHANQRSSLSSQIGDVAAGLAGLTADLKQAGLWHNSAIVLFSEFGRTNYENNADPNRAGTDHGYANFHLVLGGAVQEGVAGENPTASELTSRNYLRPSLDFRQVLKELLTWAGINSSITAQVLDEGYPSQGAIGLFA